MTVKLPSLTTLCHVGSHSGGRIAYVNLTARYPTGAEYLTHLSSARWASTLIVELTPRQNASSRPVGFNGLCLDCLRGGNVASLSYFIKDAAALRTITKAIAAYRNDGNHAYTLHAKTDLFSPAKGLLTSSQVFELFKAQGPGQPGSGLNLAMADRKAGAVSVFLANVTDTAIAGHLTPVQLKALFAAPDETGTPGIEASWSSADHKTLKAVVQQLERCQQHNLLSAADIRQTVVGDARKMNRSALSGASQDTVKAFEKTLRPLVRSGALNKDDVKSLLAAHGFRK